MITPTDILIAARLWAAVAAARDTHPPEVVGAVPVMVVQEALRADVDPALAVAVMWRESRGRPDGRSYCCIGPMQVAPRYHCETPDCGGVHGQVRAGVGVLARYTRRYGLHDGLAAYACGPARRERCVWYATQVGELADLLNLEASK